MEEINNSDSYNINNSYNVPEDDSFQTNYSTDDKYPQKKVIKGVNKISNEKENEIDYNHDSNCHSFLKLLNRYIFVILF